MNPVQKTILKILKESKEEFTINQISELAQVDRHTAGKYLESLEAMGMCQFRTQGKSKLWSLAASPLFTLISKDNPVSHELKELLEKVEENVTFQDTEHSIIWSNKPEQTGKKCYEVFAGKEQACKNCDISESISKGTPIKGQCEHHKLTGTPIKNKDNEVIASINIRKPQIKKGESHE